MKRAYDVKRTGSVQSRKCRQYVVYQWGGGSLHGKCETVCKSVRAMRCADNGDVREKLYPGMRHDEILNERQGKGLS